MQWLAAKPGEPAQWQHAAHFGDTMIYATAAEPVMAARVPELLRQQGFRRYWSAQTISMFGDQISTIAIPYTGILALHAGAAQMGYLTALIWLPSLIFGLHAGVWADRRGHRRILMITADLGRAGLLAAIPAPRCTCWRCGSYTASPSAWAR